MIILERLFSKRNKEKKDKRNRIALEDVNSHRGLGRSAILGALAPGMIGGYVGKKAANKADKEGKSDEEILKKAQKTGAIGGAIPGVALGAGTSLVGSHVYNKYGPKIVDTINAALKDQGYDDDVNIKFNKLGKGSRAKKALIAAGLAGGFGALGGYLGARKNTKKRLEKRNKMEK